MRPRRPAAPLHPSAGRWCWSQRDRKSTRLNSSHTVIYTLSLHDALPILLGRPLPPPLSGSGDAASASGGAIAPIGGALVLVAAGGSTYHVVIGPVRASPRLFGELELPGVPLTVLAIALGVSAAVCFF